MSSNLKLSSQLRQRQDLRSLAVFRILLGLYFLYDIASRLQHGRLSLLFYTSSPPSFLHPNDTPHRNPIHLIWFYRGSEIFQICLFTFTALLALFYSLGYSVSSSKSTCCGSFLYVKMLLWFSVTAMQCRNMHVHDGSDTFTRHLLLWSIFLPMNKKWSIDSYLLERRRKFNIENEKKRNEKKQINDDTNTPLVQQQMRIVEEDSNLAVWGLRLQIVFMYLGTIAARTIDVYGFSMYQNFSHCEWLPPSLTAVHYSLNASFSVRDCWLGDIVRNNFLLTQIMTMSATIIEGIVPILCLIFGMTETKNGYILPFLLFKLHFGLLLLMNLPNWQFAGMIASVVWIQSSTWDRLQRQLSIAFPNMIVPPLAEQSTDARRKKDIDVHQVVTVKPKRSRLKSFFSSFFFIYMIYNFAGERKWISKHDGGDIGEFLRFSQYWVMFATPPKTSEHIIFSGVLRSKDNNQSSEEFIEVDVWKWMKDKSLLPIDVEAQRSIIWNNMTETYPSPRLERMFDQLASRRKHDVLRYFLKKMCLNSPFTKFKFIVQYLKVMPPSVPQRFEKRMQDTVLQENCSSEPNSSSSSSSK